jgi:microcystin-dependent protein
MAVSTNPGTLLGFGTWEAYATGQVLVGYESSGTFDSLDESLGAETAAHTLTTSETPAHTHSMGTQVSFNVSLDDRQVTVLDPFWSGFGGGSARATGSAGSGSAHSHSTLQPSVTLHIWKRTA